MSIMECRNLTKRFGSQHALAGVNLTIEPGRIVGLLGPNGSGKTTLIKIANGLINPTAGILTVGGFRPGIETKKLVSYLPDRITLPEWMNADGLIGYFSDFFQDFDVQRARTMLSELSIAPKTPIRQFSKGTREKVQLILAMSRRAKLYLLDEPIGGVDPAAREYILRTIISNYDPEAAVVISTHLISDVENILDDVLFLKCGQIILNAPAEEVRKQNGKSVDQLFREVFRC